MVYESKHPLIKHKITYLRSVSTNQKLFRELVNELSVLVLAEATADLPLKPNPVTTPLQDMVGQKVAPTIGLVPILRAGLGMVDPLIDQLPFAQVWHIGLYRDEETLEPVSYYNKLPDSPTVDIVLVLDPMLATGGSAIATIDVIKRWGVTNIKFLGLLAAPEGIKAVQAEHPDVDIHIAQIDSHLNENGYIVPGLGDAGDRQFGTVH